METDTERVRKNRQLLFELLLARSPESKGLLDLAARYGVRESRFYRGETGDNCVRCGLCVRVCRDKIGAYALCFAHRGYKRKVTTDFEALSEYCIGCGTCAEICPTGAITMKDEGDERTIYTRDVVFGRFKLETCMLCGTPYAPRKYLDFVRKNSVKTMEFNIQEDICPVCARKFYAGNLVGKIAV